MATYVLLHGAWHGGWCWNDTAERLRARGHRVTTPTQTGLGERRHLMSREITLETFGNDLIEHMFFEEIENAILVGHSFGGNALSIAAERVPGRIRRLVYLDSMLLLGGESAFGQVPPATAEARRKAAQDHDGGVSIPPPSPESFGITDPEQAEWLAARLTPHPLSVYEAPLPISGRPGHGLPCLYAECTEPTYPPLAASRERARDWGWRIDELAACHDAMVSEPTAVAALLEAEAHR